MCSPGVARSQTVAHWERRAQGIRVETIPLLWPGHRVFRPEEYERGFLVPTGDNTPRHEGKDLAQRHPRLLLDSCIQLHKWDGEALGHLCPMVVSRLPETHQRDPLPTTGFPFQKKAMEWLIECGGHLEQSRHADISLSGFQGREETWAHPGLLGKLPDAPLFAFRHCRTCCPR